MSNVCVVNIVMHAELLLLAGSNSLCIVNIVGAELLLLVGSNMSGMPACLSFIAGTIINDSHSQSSTRKCHHLFHASMALAGAARRCANISLSMQAFHVHQDVSLVVNAN